MKKIQVKFVESEDIFVPISDLDNKGVIRLHWKPF